MVILEAMALGVPVVATAVGGVPEVITNNDSGLLVPPGTPEQLAESMRHLLTHSSTTLMHLREARVLFEVQMVRTAATKRNDDDIARLRDALARQSEAKSDHGEFLKRDGKFHQEIARISGNPIFEGLSESFFEWLRHFQLNLVSSPGLEDLVLEEHAQILDAIIAGDADEAQKRISDHLYRANARYRQLNKD